MNLLKGTLVSKYTKSTFDSLFKIKKKQQYQSLFLAC
jgi:hypothetical protein